MKHFYEARKYLNRFSSFLILNLIHTKGNETRIEIISAVNVRLKLMRIFSMAIKMS